MNRSSLWQTLLSLIWWPRPSSEPEYDLAYGSDSLQKLDVYHPERRPNGIVIFMVHGGGWRRGDKRADNVLGNKLAYYLSLGYTFVSVNYRLGASITPLDQANDVAKALAFCQDRARSWGCSPGKFILMGHSAGAHLVALLAAASAIGLANGTRPWLGTVCLDSAAYNVVSIMEAPHPALYDEAFGADEALWYEASPFHRLNRTPQPVLLVASVLEGEETDRYENVVAFSDKVENLNGRAPVLPVELDHGDTNSQLGLPGQYTASVDSFLEAIQ